MKRPSILYLVTEDWYFWKHRAPLARAVRDAGYNVIVAAAPSEYGDAIRDEGFAYHPLSLHRHSTNPAIQFKVIQDITALYKEINPDIVHHVALKPILLGSTAAHRAGIRHIVNAVTGLGYVFIRGGLKRQVLRLGVTRWLRSCLLQNHTHTIFQNPDDMSFFVNEGIVQRTNAVLIKGSGVDTNTFAPAPEPGGPPSILFAARMLWDKGVGELIDAAHMLERLNIEFTVRLAGIPDPHNPASIPEETLREWANDAHIEWLGYQNDMPSLIANSNIVCLPTYREGAPLSLIEAASAGRPIVTTDTPGCRDIVHNHVNGFLVPPRDPESLADALLCLINAPDLRKRMGKAGREIALRDFSIETVASQTLALYESMLKKEPAMGNAS